MRTTPEGTSCRRPPGDTAITYGYTDANWKDKLTSYNGQSITYDAIGNPLSYRDGLTFTWKNGRQLAALSKTGTSASYKYDDSGVRTSKTVNGVTTTYYFAGSQALGQSSSDGSSVKYLMDVNGGIYGIYYMHRETDATRGDTYYFAYNAQGDVIGLYNYGGALMASYSYDEWGNCTATALIPDSQNHAVTDPKHVAFANPFRYRGYYFDAESGLYYLQSRYYDPVVGRFINGDGLLGSNGDILSYNLFAYCNNNPINCYDPSGEAPLFTSLIGELIKIAMEQIKTMNEFKSAYKNFNGSDYTIDEEKYSGFSISKKQIIVDGKDELYSEIITWSTMAIATTLQPKIMALDFALLFAPKDKTPYGSYTQYTVILYEKPIEKSYPIKHGPYVIGSKTMVFQNYTVETYIVGPGTAGMVIKSGTYFYDAEKMHYYATHPGARR